MNWFGVKTVYPGERRVPAPVGVPCGYCEEAVTAEDRGCTIPDADGGELPYHFECHIRLAIGSVAHQRGQCSCSGGRDHDPPGLTRRQAARAALDYWLTYGRE